MRTGWRTVAGIAAFSAASFVFLAATVEFVAPDLAYAIKDRVAELFSGNAGRKYRIGLGSTTGSGYLVGTVLNERLAARAGYELELVSRPAAGAVAALLDPAEPVDLAIINSASDEAIGVDGVLGVAALETQYFFVVVPNDSAVVEFRDLAGRVNPGSREPGQPMTLGERVLDFYGLTAGGEPGRVEVVRPKLGTNVEDFAAGHMVAATRTQSLYSDLIGNIMNTGDYRLVPIADTQALATFLSGTRPGFIPAGLYGPDRRLPAEPVPTITVTQLLVSRANVPARVVRDILEAVYDPIFARELRYALDEQSGGDLAGLPLHPAAEIYYHRNDAVTADRVGRLSFLATVIAALFAGLQVIVRLRRRELARTQRALLAPKVAALQVLRHRIEVGDDASRALVQEADELLAAAEVDYATGGLDAGGIQSLRSMHRTCRLAARRRPHAAVADAT
jgi:TRAP-type uncharacterized transport system substrate-binding protein